MVLQLLHSILDVPLLDRREEFLNRRPFVRNITVDLFSIGVVIRKRGVDLCKRHVIEFGDDLFGREAQVGPSGNSHDRDARSGNRGRPFRISGDLSIRAAVLLAISFSVLYNSLPHILPVLDSL